MLRIKTDKQFFSWDRAVVMGIMNVTPDSFYDGGRYQGIDAVLNHVKHDFIYMCAKEDFSGTHNFAVTYDEHLNNARKYSEALNKTGVK